MEPGAALEWAAQALTRGGAAAVGPEVGGTPALLPLLVLAALRPGPDPTAGTIGAALRDATCLTWAAMALGEHVVGASPPPATRAAAPRARSDHAIRLSALVAGASARLLGAAPPGARWAPAFGEAWGDHAAHLARADAPGGPTSWEPWRAGDRLAPLSILALCALEVGGRGHLSPTLAPLLAEAAGLYLGLEALRQVRLDRAAGLADPAATAAPPAGWSGRGATSARALAASWRAYGFAAVGALMEVWATELEAVGPTVVVSPAPRTDRPLDDALRAGRAALDDDPEGREAREIYRWGFLEVNPLVSTVFPHGTILESRLRAGEARGGEVDALLRRYAANQFHYFDQPTGLPFDIDTFGLAARLAAASPDPAAARQLLEAPLGWVLANVAPDGDVPVFLTRGVDAGDGRRYISTFGNACAGVQANLLLGLLALPGPRPEAAIRRIGAHLCDRFASEGAAALAHYDALYGAYVVREALDAWAAAVPAARPGVVEARSRALEVIERACRADRPSPLELAWRWLATAAPDARPLRRGAWLTELLLAQEADGGWPAAPFYRMPSRGNHGERYASRSLTTAFACLALARAETT